MVSDFSCDLFQLFMVCKFLMEGPLKTGFCRRATLLKRFKYEIYEI